MKKMDFSSLLNQQIKKVSGQGPAVEEKPEPKGKAQEISIKEIEIEKTGATPIPTPPPPEKQNMGKSAPRNINRVTVNLFEADRRALGVIKELLGSAGHDFTNRSDSMKVGLRLAAKAKPEELAKILKEVRAEDRRFSH